MANIASDGILAMLKTFYAKEGVENLLYRNDPLLKKIKKERVEGKQANFSALYSRGGAVSANALKAEQLAKETAQAKEFQVTPGQLFSACKFNNKELLASRTMKGAYIPVAAAKFFANAESFRKTMAVALYGSGHGELYTLATAQAFTMPASGTTVDVTMPRYAIMGIDIGSDIEFKASASATAVIAEGLVTAINDTVVTIKSMTGTSGTTTSVPAGSVACLAGCTDDDGSAMLPVGLAGWLPKSLPASDSFYGVDRSVARDRLAGTVVAADTTKYETIENAILRLRAMGSLCDIIVMNDEDYLAMAKEIETKTYFQKVDGGKKNKATVGYDGFGFAVSSNWVDNVMDSPYCPKGTAYVLSSDSLELWTYTNADKIDDGIAENAAGKPDVTGESDVQNKPYQLLVDDVFSIKSGDTDANGDVAIVKLNFFGTFVVTNPSVNAVVTLA